MKPQDKYKRTPQEHGVVLAKPVNTADWFPDETQKKLDKYMSKLEVKTIGELILLIGAKTKEI